MALDQFAVAQFLEIAPVESDFSVHDNVAAVGDAAGLVEILFRHEYSEAESPPEFGNDINGLGNE